MSEATIREAVLDWFRPPNVEYLNALYRAEPIFASGTDWQLDQGVGFGAMGYVHIVSDGENRIAFGGATGGIKSVLYTVGLVLLYRYVIPSDLTDYGPDAWVDGQDTLIENVKERLRADRTLGTGPTGVVWQAGEGDSTGAPDIRVQHDLPKRSPNKVESWSVVEFDVIENVYA